MAAHFSSTLTGLSLERSVWFNTFDERECRQWVEECQGAKRAIWSEIEESISKESIKKELWPKMFFFQGNDSISIGCIGCFFGGTIIKTVSEKIGALSLMRWKPEQFKQFIEVFFNSDG